MQEKTADGRRTHAWVLTENKQTNKQIRGSRKKRTLLLFHGSVLLEVEDLLFIVIRHIYDSMHATD